jgi:hypothetical protein
MTRRNVSRILSLLAGTVILVCAVLAWVPSPFVWLAGAGAIACALAARKSGRGWLRVACVNAGLLLLLFGAIEAAFAMLLTRRNRSFPEYPPQYFQPDDELGGAAQKGASHVTKRTGSTMVYDVTYTIGGNGLRIAPPDRGKDAKACALFFGDSFMFGEGLADDQTIPWRVGVLTGGDTRAFNFGFHGFGAQQMLAALQSDRVAKTVDCRPTHIIYEAIPDHVARAAGYYGFMRHGPRYALVYAAGARADSVMYRGHFDDAENNRSAIGAAIANAMAKSWLYRWLSSLSPLPDDEDLKRYVAIVTSAARVAAARYPGSRFDVLYWDIHGETPMDEKVLPALRAAGLNVFDAEQILPGFRENPSSFALSRFDAHPGARADDLLATYLVQQRFR